MKPKAKEKYLKELGERVKALRLERGLRQEDFEDESDLAITSRALQHVEYGDKEPRIYTLYKIALRLKVPLADLLPDSRTGLSSKS